MRRMLVFTLLSLSLAACADPTTARHPTAKGAGTAPEVDERRLGVYTSLIFELVGAEPIEWQRVYVVTALCDDAADPMGPEACDDSLTRAERNALRERLDLEHLRFIDDPARLYDEEWMQGVPNEIVLRLGPIVERAGKVRVGASFGCGGLCGGGSTYVLQERDGRWSVVGQRGPMWIA